MRLTPKEFAVLRALVQAEGGVLRAEQVGEQVWDANAGVFTNSPRPCCGHGLGLAIAHDGRLRLTPNHDGGLITHLDLPRAKAEI
ncbi:winged helix-turn-helix domain-containing protein [Streptomyces violaceusniger]|uniref:helix-turn-helix domain-containing protein n=1 Tax=Streptomyces violaceusniger TaxID=68280 RepID=UPI003421D81B